MKIKKSLVKFVSPDTPHETKLDYAKLDEPDIRALAPEDLVTVLFVLSYDQDRAVALAAGRSFKALPLETIMEALKERLDPRVLARIGILFGNREVYSAILSNPGVDDAFLTEIARRGTSDAVEALVACAGKIKIPAAAVEALMENPRAPAGAARAISNRAAPAGREEAPPVEVSGEDFEDVNLNIYQMIMKMSASEKIKLALTGDKAAREILIKDKNNAVSSAVLKNPRITEQEIVKIASSKSTSDELLREIGSKREWLKNYNVKAALVFNPKNPLSSSLKLLDYLYERDIKKLARSKNVPGVLVNAARRKLSQKQGH